MIKREIAIMLSFSSTLDGRVPFDEAAVEAWSLVLDADMDARWASGYAKKHYAKTDDIIHPSGFNKAWADAKRNRAALALTIDKELLDRHCQRANCSCTHTGTCYRGWIDAAESSTSPCPVCRSSLSNVLALSPPLGLRTQHDYDLIRNRYRES